MATWQLRWIKPPPMICTCCEQPSLMEAANALLYTPSVCPSVCPVTVPFTKRADTPLCRRAVQLARSQQQLFLFRRDLCVILFGVLAVFWLYATIISSFMVMMMMMMNRFVAIAWVSIVKQSRCHLGHHMPTHLLCGPPLGRITRYPVQLSVCPIVPEFVTFGFKICYNS